MPYSTRGNRTPQNAANPPAIMLVMDEAGSTHKALPPMSTARRPTATIANR